VGEQSAMGTKPAQPHFPPRSSGSSLAGKSPVVAGVCDPGGPARRNNPALPVTGHHARPRHNSHSSPPSYSSHQSEITLFNPPELLASPPPPARHFTKIAFIGNRFTLFDNAGDTPLHVMRNGKIVKLMPVAGARALREEPPEYGGRKKRSR